MRHSWRRSALSADEAMSPYSSATRPERARCLNAAFPAVERTIVEDSIAPRTKGLFPSSNRIYGETVDELCTSSRRGLKRQRTSFYDPAIVSPTPLMTVS